MGERAAEGQQGAGQQAQRGRGRGRPAVSSRDNIERAALELFLEYGYGETSIPMIAAASGVSRTTFFRYWGSKSELVWAVFDVHTLRLAELLEAAPVDVQAMTVVRTQVVENLRLSIGDSGQWMQRFAVLDSSSDLRSDESVRWIRWAWSVASFVAAREGLRADGVVAQSIGAAVQAAFLTVLRSWVAIEGPSEKLLPELDAALAPLTDILQTWLDQVAASPNAR